MAVAKEYTINDPDDLLECPYESAHMIRAKRMQYHLMKCRKVGIGYTLQHYSFYISDIYASACIC